MSGFRLPFNVAQLCGVIERGLHFLFYLNVRLSSGKDLTHCSDIVLQKVLV